MTIFWHPTGPLVKYKSGLLYIENLNPEMKTKWRMSRAEMPSVMLFDGAMDSCI
jgi:hypothetical protein